MTAQTFFRRLSQFQIAVADVTEVEPNSWLLTRLLVPAPCWGKGTGTEIMQELCAWVDGNGYAVSLHLIPLPGTDEERVKAFVTRFGFKEQEVQKYLV